MLGKTLAISWVISWLDGRCRTTDPPGAKSRQKKKKRGRGAVGLGSWGTKRGGRGKEGGERNVLGGLLGMTDEVGRVEELAMLMLELRAWRYSGGMLAMGGRDERRRWVEEEE